MIVQQRYGSMRRVARAVTDWARVEVPVGVVTGVVGSVATLGFTSVSAATAMEVGLGFGLAGALAAHRLRLAGFAGEVVVLDFGAWVHLMEGGTIVELRRSMLVEAVGVRTSFDIGALGWPAGQADLEGQLTSSDSAVAALEVTPQPNGMFGLRCRPTFPLAHGERLRVGFTVVLHEPAPVPQPYVALNTPAFVWAPGARATLGLTWDATSAPDPVHLAGLSFRTRSDTLSDSGVPISTVRLAKLDRPTDELGVHWTVAPRDAVYFKLGVHGSKRPVLSSR